MNQFKDKEQSSITQLHLFESSVSSLPERSLIAGVDEVGRGALFGPVVSAAVILSSSSIQQLKELGVTDSKKLSPDKRNELALSIHCKAIDCKIGWASVREIDQLNILHASLLSMKRAIMKLDPAPNLCLIDGNQPVPDIPYPQLTLIKGDLLSVPIASASIIAKVWRDKLITKLSKRYPGYNLELNKGYGTVSHRKAIQLQGTTSQHRRSFKPCQPIETNQDG